MISIRISSRLGNQMFQYAFAYSVAKSFKTFFFVETSNAGYGYIIPKYFRLSKRNTIFQFICAEYYSWLYHKNYFHKVQFSGFDVPKNVLRLTSDKTEYSGYFQSLEYFSEHQQKIKHIFRIRKQFVCEFRDKYLTMFKERKTIAVHIRRTDFIDYGKDSLGGKNVCLPDRYFVDCLNKIENLDRYNLMFISDDMDYVQNTFSALYPMARFDTNSEIVDFQILVNADVLILSNSTFSWWGAYLNSRSGKIVYAPKYWLGFKVQKEYPENILIPSWIIPDVLNK